jgi:hypothetical protein
MGYTDWTGCKRGGLDRRPITFPSRTNLTSCLALGLANA